jgi:hypothetical protein
VYCMQIKDSYSYFFYFILFYFISIKRNILQSIAVVVIRNQAEHGLFVSRLIQ